MADISAPIRSASETIEGATRYATTAEGNAGTTIDAAMRPNQVAGYVTTAISGLASGQAVRRFKKTGINGMIAGTDTVMFHTASDKGLFFVQRIGIIKKSSTGVGVTPPTWSLGSEDSASRNNIFAVFTELSLNTNDQYFQRLASFNSPLTPIAVPINKDVILRVVVGAVLLYTVYTFDAYVEGFYEADAV